MDRTNVTQTKICLQSIEQILQMVKRIIEITREQKNQLSPRQIFSEAMSTGLYTGPASEERYT